MNKRNWTAVALMPTIFCPIIFSACKSDSLPVNLAPGFVGDVRINCVSAMENVRPVDIGATGNVDAVCPMHRTALTITRGGKSVGPTGNVIWETTGDGIPVGIRFKVG